MGVSPEALQAIGKLVVATSRLEWVLALVAREVGVAKPTVASSQVITEVRRAARSLPAPIDVLRPKVLDWIEPLPPLLEERHQAIHGVPMMTMSPGGTPEPVVHLMRQNRSVPVDPARLEQAAEELAVLYTAGMNLFGELHIANELRASAQGKGH